MDKFQEEIIKLAETDFFQLAKRESNSRTRIRLLALVPQLKSFQKIAA